MASIINFVERQKAESENYNSNFVGVLTDTPIWGPIKEYRTVRYPTPALAKERVLKIARAHGWIKPKFYQFWRWFDRPQAFLMIDFHKEEV